MAIETTTLQDTTYYSTNWRGIQYRAHNNGTDWVVETRRVTHKHLAPSTRHFASLRLLATTLTAFSGLDALIDNEIYH